MTTENCSNSEARFGAQTAQSRRFKLTFGVWLIAIYLKNAVPGEVLMAKPYFYEGKTFSSLSHLHKEFAHPTVSYGALASRIKAGLSLNDALNTPKKQERKARQFVVNDVVFKSIKHLAPTFGLSYDQAYRRVIRGWSDNEVAYGRSRSKKQKHKEKPADKRATAITFNGIFYPNTSKLCQAFGVKRNVFYARRRSGWSMEECLGTIPRVRTNRARASIPRIQVECNGEQFRSFSAFCRAHDIEYSISYNRYKLGWTPEQLAGITTMALIKKRRPLKIKGKTYPSIDAAAQYFSVHPSTIAGRLDDGLSHEQAVGIEPIFGKHKITIDSNIFNSAADAARYYGKKPSLVQSRLGNGWGIKEALGVIKRDKNSRNHGAYNEKYFVKYPQKKYVSSNLYFAHYTSHERKTQFHKIGISTRSSESRLNRTAYTYILLAEKIMPLYDAWKFEQKILKLYQDNKYVVKDLAFDGRTECFQFADDLEKEIISHITHGFNQQNFVDS